MTVISSVKHILLCFHHGEELNQNDEKMISLFESTDDTIKRLSRISQPIILSGTSTIDPQQVTIDPQQLTELYSKRKDKHIINNIIYERKLKWEIEMLKMKPQTKDVKGELIKKNAEKTALQENRFKKTLEISNWVNGIQKAYDRSLQLTPPSTIDNSQSQTPEESPPSTPETSEWDLMESQV